MIPGVPISISPYICPEKGRHQLSCQGAEKSITWNKNRALLSASWWWVICKNQTKTISCAMVLILVLPVRVGKRMTSPFSFMNNSDLTFRKEQTVANHRERVILGPTYCIVVLGVFCPNNTNDDEFHGSKSWFSSYHYHKRTRPPTPHAWRVGSSDRPCEWATLADPQVFFAYIQFTSWNHERILNRQWFRFRLVVS